MRWPGSRCRRWSGRLIGPPLGGFITTYLTWHWIFLINIPIGLLGIFMALALHRSDPQRGSRALRSLRLVLAGIGLGGIAFGLSIAGLNLVAVDGGDRADRNRHHFDDALCDPRQAHCPRRCWIFALLRLPTMRASINRRLSVPARIGALPFLLPLLMQGRLRLSPLRSGLVTFASAGRPMGMKTLAARIIRTFGFRNIMVINAVVSFGLPCGLRAGSRSRTPLLLIMILLVVGGFFRSLQFTAINTLAYAEVEPAQMSRATTLVQRQSAAGGFPPASRSARSRWKRTSGTIIRAS